MTLYYSQNGIIVRKATMADAIYLKDKLRESDCKEVWSSNHHTPEEALRLSLEKSIWSACVQNGHPIALFGINPDNVLGRSAVVWFLASNDLKTIERRFLKNSKNIVKYMLSFYPLLYNYVKADHYEAINWLRFCGAKIYDPKPYGKEQQLFRYFEFKRGDLR